MRVPHNIKESAHMGRRRAKEPKSVQVCLRLTPQQYAILRAYTQIKGYQQVGDSLRWVIDGMERWCRDKAPDNQFLEKLDKIRVQGSASSGNGSHRDNDGLLDHINDVDFNSSMDTGTNGPVGYFAGRPAVKLPEPPDNTEG